jgi:hypothetical protein
MTPAERERRRRARRKAGRRIYSAELDEVDFECLLESFGVSSLRDLAELLIRIDRSVAPHGMKLGNVFLSLAAELQITPTDEV